MANHELVNQSNALYDSMMGKREAANAILTYEELHNEAGIDLLDRNNGLFMALTDASLQKLIDGAPAFWAEKNRSPALEIAKKRHEELQQQMLEGHPVTVEALAKAKSLADAETMHNELSMQRDIAVATAKAERIKRRTAAIEQAKKQLPQVPHEELANAKQTANEAIAAYNAVARDYNEKLEAVRQSMEDNDVLRTDFHGQRPDYFDEESDWDNSPYGQNSGLTLDGQKHSPISRLKLG